MTLQQLTYFLASAEHGSFSAAAESLHMAQPSMSEQIRRLEAELGVPLFARAGRRLELTEAGRLLLPEAERTLAAAQAAQESVREVRDVTGGTVAFGTFGSAHHYLLGGLIEEFRRKHPSVRLRVVGQNSAEVADAVRDGHLEAGLVVLPVDDRGLDVRPAMQEELVYLSIEPRRVREPMTRYFPELHFPEGRYVLDGEVVLFDEQGRQDFDALGQRIHPAESRIRMLAEQTPTRFIAFDLLAHDDDVLLELPQAERRDRLAQLIDKPVDLTPSTEDPDEAQPWLEGAEGVIAKRQDAPYLPGERKGMAKIKRVRTIDAVVVGWRPGKEENTVGSLILGLYDDAGELRTVGHTSGLSAKRKRELIDELKPYETGERGMGDPSRWANDRDLEWVALRPELVVEVTFDHTSNDRIRHGTKLSRWREDKDPADCRMDQLQS